MSLNVHQRVIFYVEIVQKLFGACKESFSIFYREKVWDNEIAENYHSVCVVFNYIKKSFIPVLMELYRVNVVFSISSIDRPLRTLQLEERTTEPLSGSLTYLLDLVLRQIARHFLCKFGDVTRKVGAV